MPDTNPVARVIPRADGTWAARAGGASAEIQHGTPPVEICALAMALLENADYRERFAARKHVQ